ncbi:helix-turn-helix domain-containing protein [Rhodocaloribacter litoris]|uniref:helix-turn-helix domain-containing protein n=1 Tax=Rhodocaloribacter litoris TaxID=2558931 RepID=UPI00141F02E0|nr:helix-turn-helix domain-containing protein [Rhodocaloribacter litoris]QXD16989.1 helix-turn-helix domain-containing protein [Rhodocaloribacter litoris]
MKKPNASDRLLTVREVLDILRIGRTTLHQLRRRGVIEAVHIGRAVRFRASDIERLIEHGAEVER